MASIAGALIRQYPEIPEVDVAPYVDPVYQQRRAEEGNLANLPISNRLASSVNLANSQERLKYLGGVPGFDLLGKGADIYEDYLFGRIPEDVQRSVQDTTAGRAWSSGVGGSPFGQAWMARDLGLTSLGLQQGALSALPGFVGSTANLMVPPQYDPTRNFLTTGQAIGTEQWNEENRFSRNQLQNYLNSLPDPKTAAVLDNVAGIFDTIEGLGKTALTSYLGGMMGGLGGAGASAAGLGGGGGGGGTTPGYIGGGVGGGGGGIDLNSILRMFGGGGGR